jgi:hypothetical protein
VFKPQQEIPMIWQKVAAIVIPAVALALGGSSEAQADFITNGGFETVTGGTTGQLGYNGLTATGWSSTGYNFLYAPGTADTTGGNGVDGIVKLWGPGDGSANGLTASPAGGNFVAADGAYEVGAITQTMTGLTVGNVYQVGFWWAGAQQSGYNGITTDKWVVGFGSSTQSTAVVTDPSHGFTGWMYATFNFRADATNDVLSFLAVGTPSGEPPFSLIDGVSVTSVPEPSTLVLVGLGLLGCGVAKARRRAKTAAV